MFIQQLIRSILQGAFCLACGLALAPALAQAPAPQGADTIDYRLGGGDQLRILVYQSPDLTLETRLSDRGVVSYPLLGNLQLGGLTVGEAEQLIAEGLKKGEFLKNPQVTLILLEVRGHQVNVLGQVGKPGRYPLVAGITRLSDMVATAGGVSPDLGSDVVTVVGTRDGRPFRRTIDLPEIFSSAERANDLVLQANDVIYVERAPVFYIYGEVQRPGQLRLARGMTLLQGLAAGGGLTLRGSDKGIRVHRRGTQGKTEVQQPGMDEPLRDGDVIYVRESLF